MKRPAVTAACRPLFEALETRSLMSTVSVTSLADSGPGSLRDAVAGASAGDTIDLGGLTGTITLVSQITIDKDLDIDGPGAADLTVSGDHHATRAFAVDSGLTVTMADFTIDNAGTSGLTGGAIDVNGFDRAHPGTLTLTDMVLSNNLATGTGGAVAVRNSDLVISGTRFTHNDVVYAGGYADVGGGAVSVRMGGLTATDSTFDGNTVTATDDGSSHGFGISPSARGGAIEVNNNTGNGDVPHGVTVTDCTMIGNTAAADGPNGGDAMGGGMLVIVDAKQLLLTNNTITGNVATSTSSGSSSGGGVYLYEQGMDGGTFRFVNNVVYGNTAADFPDARVWAMAGWTAKNNLLGADFDNYGYGSITGGTDGNVTGVDPLLGVLADNGGPVPTIELRAGSPAIDAGTTTNAPAADARGVSRGAAYDIGAFEYVALTPPPAPVNHAPAFTSTPVTTVATGGQYTYNIVATDADHNPLTIVLVSTTVPGLSLVDNGDGTATLSGLPTLPQNGSGTVNLSVSDGVDTTPQSFTLTATGPANHAPVFTSTPAATAPVGLAWEYTPTATDADGDAVSYAIRTPGNGSQTAFGLEFNWDGTYRLRGTPGPDDAGVYTFDVVATDAHGADAVQHVTLTVPEPDPAFVANGVLYVNGTAAADDIHVFSPRSRPDTVRATVNGRSWNFATAVINGVCISSRAGDDVVMANAPVGAYAYGGAGDDRITGGDQNDTLSGGMGNDTIDGGAGDDLLNGHGGADSLDGGAGDDRLRGFGGRDTLVDRLGTNAFDGGDNRDTLVGAAADSAVDDVLDLRVGTFTLLA